MTIKKKKPFLSIVCSCRNDDFGGDMLKRLKAFFDGLSRQAEKFALDCELVVVEWNPSEDRARIGDLPLWSGCENYVSVRIIEVTGDIHNHYQYSDIVPMHVCVALNVGIRRARGEFLLTAPIDVLYSDELIEFISSGKLEENKRYRVDRIDVNALILEDYQAEEMLKRCRCNIVHVNSNLNCYNAFGLPNLHTNACGDFQLMARKHWELLRGFREEEITGVYADGLLSFASFAADIEEVFLPTPCMVYHINHKGGFREKIPFYRNKGVVIPEYIETLEIFKRLARHELNFVFNDESWGLARENLKDEFIVKAFWE